MRLENSSKFNFAPVPPRSLPSRSTWFNKAQRESVRGDGRGGGCDASSCNGKLEDDGTGGGRDWIGEGGSFGAVASASGEEDGRDGGAGKEVVPLG